ncbi:hypothetical protein RFI_01036 [Reticulomyxa filosa]|uniref:Uncharacterized protein n=1 Tax=Reticulomyxa filosa TaxID=46433 RepID=X6PCT5_RETFI|nr:hypothetical protein RFI_01036 [Reticulomyxa filosa]|eukprot:ETO36026.1 hypothetical protein RFI_01036 [Reticulomyxa filosa]
MDQEKNLYSFHVDFLLAVKTFFCNLIYMTKIKHFSLRKLFNAFSQYHSQILLSYQAKTHKYFRNNTHKKKFTTKNVNSVLIKQSITNLSLGRLFSSKKINNYLVLHTSITRHFVSAKFFIHKSATNTLCSKNYLYKMTILSSDRKQSKHHIKEAYFPLFFFKCICIHSFPTQ